MSVVFSLGRQLKRENLAQRKAMGAMNRCKHIRHSYLNLSLISGLPRKGFSLLNGCKHIRHSFLNLSLISGLPRKGFSLLNEYRRETDNGEEKAPKAENAQDTPCQDSRVYSISWTIRQDDRVLFVGS